jgi:tight adherence protein B
MGLDLMVVVAAVLGFVALAGVGLAFAGGGGQTRTLKRAHAIVERKQQDPARARPAQLDPATRRKQILRTLKDQDKQQRQAALNLTARLSQAGMQISSRTFWIICGGLGLATMGATVVLGQPIWIGLALGVGAGLGLPRWVIGFLAKRRSKKFVAEFSDAMDIIVRGIKSGLPVNECLHIISRESSEPLASEFRHLVDGVSHGLPMDQALDRMYEHMPIQELRFFSIVLAIQQKAGGNLAEALANLSAVVRARKLMREKIKAMSSEATASAMIIGALPPGVVLLIWVTTPSYMSMMFTDPRGQMMIAGSLVWMGLGILMMRKMINFKF